MAVAWNRAEVLAALAPQRPGEVLAAARQLQNEQRRVTVQAALTLHLAETEHLAVLYTLWQEALSLLSRYTRPDLLFHLTTLIPVIPKRSGDKGLADALDAVQKACTWRP